MNRPERLPPILSDLLATRESPEPSDETQPSRSQRRTRTRGGEQRTLFGEILDWMMVPLLLLWPLSVAITFVVARSIADGPFDRTLQERLQLIAGQVSFIDGQAVVPGALLVRDATPGADPAAPFYVQVRDADGRLLAGDPELPAPSRIERGPIGASGLRYGHVRGEELRIASIRIAAPQSMIASPPSDPMPGAASDARDDGDRPLLDEPSEPSVLVQVGETLAERTRLANEIIKGVILPQFLILPLALGLVWFGLGRGLQPLRLMRERIRGRRQDDLSPIDPRGVPQEISPLVDEFNDLLARLGNNIRVQKRFIADAAHQMKTPLAGLRTQAELALRGSDPQEIRRSVELLAQGSNRAAHLVQQLLALARMENLRDSTVLEAIDLNPIAREVCTEWADRAIQRGIDFGFDSDDEPAPIAGNALMLHELCANLIDNALRYTAPGGEVTLRVHPLTDRVLLEVVDSGLGIPENERELVFDRFYRVLGTETEGSGLGLAIVREIGNHHDAEITLEDAHAGRTPPGLRVRVAFPKALDG